MALWPTVHHCHVTVLFLKCDARSVLSLDMRLGIWSFIIVITNLNIGLCMSCFMH